MNSDSALQLTAPAARSVRCNRLRGCNAYVLLSGVAWSVASALAMAADNVSDSPAAALAEPPALEEIMVTAQRRSENLQNVPIAVVALSAQELAKSNATDVTDLRSSVAGLNVISAASYSSPFLRGVGSTALGPGIESPVATYVDGIYIGVGSTALVSFNNVSQVEVLKGPQGTLFGRNATGGLIQVTTRDPGQTATAEGALSYGNFNDVRGNVYVAGPLSDTLAADFALVGEHQGDGWGRNETTGNEVYTIPHDISARSKWIWTPTDSTRVTFIQDYNNVYNTMLGYTTLPGTMSSVTPGVVYNPKGWNVDTNTDNHHSGWAEGTSLKVEQDLPGVRIISTSAYRKSSYLYYFDLDYTPAPVSRIDATQKDHAFTQELQLQSADSHARLNWVAGVFYYDAVGSYDPSHVLLDAAGLNIETLASQGDRSIAGYGQATYELIQDTKLTVGLRYTSESRRLDGGDTLFLEPGDVQITPTNYDGVNEKETFNKLTFRVALDHRFSDSLLGYVSFNRGFKSGGYDAGAVGLAPYSPETLDATELGFKSDLLDNHLRVNIAGFYYNYKNLQVQFIAPNGGSVGIINGANAHIYGVDADLSAVLTPDLRLSAGIELLNDKFISFPDAFFSTPGGGVPLYQASAAGNQLPFASKGTANVTLDYGIDVGPGRSELNLTGMYNNGWFPGADNVIHQPAFFELNSSIRWAPTEGHYYVGLYGKNLTNKRVQAYVSNSPEGTNQGFYAPPRQYGVTVGFKF